MVNLVCPPEALIIIHGRIMAGTQDVERKLLQFSGVRVVGIHQTVFGGKTLWIAEL